MSGRRLIGPVDTIWLNMDRPSNLMVIHSLILLDGRLDPDRLRSLLESRLLGPYPVFRQRARPPVLGLGLPYWEDDPDFALERHLHRTTLPEPGDDAALRAYVDAQLHRPLDRSHPLWEMHVLDGYDGGSALLCRFHHALADGIALIRVLLSLTDETPEGDAALEPEGPALADRAGRPQAPSTLGLGLATVGATARVLGAAAGVGVASLGAMARLATPTGARHAMGLGLRTSLVVASLLLTENHDSPLGGDPGIAKHVVWSEPFPLPELKLAGRAVRGTLNDVLMSAVAGAFGRYVADHGGEPADLTTMVPVNLRDLGVPLPPELGNRFALVFFHYPSSVAGVRERLAETKRRMDWLKHSPEATITFQLIQGIGRTSADIERLLVDFFANKALGVTTNVPGPTTLRYFAGIPITGMLGWVPGSARQTVGVCILTYADTVRVGFLADADRVRDPEQLVTALGLEIEALTRLGRPA